MFRRLDRRRHVLGIFVLILAGFLSSALGQNQKPPENIAQLLRRPATKEAAWEQARQLVGMMTAEERFDLVSSGDAFGIAAVQRLSIPPVVFADASAGLRLKSVASLGSFEKTTAFPCTVLLASTWSGTLAYEYARALGEEARAGGVQVILGPGANIYRVSQCGRNFEYFGEDPFLSSVMVGSYVSGLQSTGVAATLKHFLGNETELHRRTANSVMDDRTLHEIYLPPFQAGIDAGAWCVMTSYNLLNGEWTGQSREVVDDLLRKELGFEWLCMTDWTSTWDGEKIAASGVDLEKPAGKSLKKVQAKLLGSPAIDRMAARILATAIAAGFYEGNFARPEWMAQWDQREHVARQVNEQGIVLLQNNGILPLDLAAVKGPILVAGVNADRVELSARGSGHVEGYHAKSYSSVAAELFPGQVLKVQTPTDEQVRSASLVLLFPGFPLKGEPGEGEGSDRPFAMADDDLVKRCVELNQKTIVCVTAGGGVAMDWAPRAAAILQVYYGGQTGAVALFDILLGKVNSSGKLPFTIEKKSEDAPGYGYDRQPFEILKRYPASYFDLRKPTPQVLWNEDRSAADVFNVIYREGIFVGYRWYDAKNIEPRFPFGHGLSYTTFRFEGLAAEGFQGDKVQVCFRLTNTGTREGAEVAQLYVAPRAPGEPRPPRELKGFQRVLLKPEESQLVSFELPRRAFEYWNSAKRSWVFEPGKYEIEVGSSSRDLPLKMTISP